MQKHMLLLKANSHLTMMLSKVKVLSLYKDCFFFLSAMADDNVDEMLSLANMNCFCLIFSILCHAEK